MGILSYVCYKKSIHVNNLIMMVNEETSGYKTFLMVGINEGIEKCIKGLGQVVVPCLWAQVKPEKFDEICWKWFCGTNITKKKVITGDP